MTETSQLYMFDDKSATSTSAPPRKQPQATVVYWLLFLLLAGSVLRLGLWLVYGPVSYPDTGTYMRLAQNILTGDFSTYDGRRPPGYPLVLAIAGLSPEVTWALQMLMGLAISVLLFYIAFTLTRRPGLAALAGMTYNLNLSQLFFEANLVSETTTTLAVTGVAALFLVSYQRIRDNRRVWPWLLLLGLFAAFATLARPQFIFLPLLDRHSDRLRLVHPGGCPSLALGRPCWSRLSDVNRPHPGLVLVQLREVWFLYHLDSDGAKPDGPLPGLYRAGTRALRDHP